MGIFSQAMNQTVNVKSATSVDDYGKPTWGSATQINARVEEQVDKIKGPDGILYDQTHVVYTETEVDEDQLFFLPGVSTANDSNGRKPLYVEKQITISATNPLYKVGL